MEQYPRSTSTRRARDVRAETVPLDHLHRLQDLLERLGVAATIPVEEAAIIAVEQ